MLPITKLMTVRWAQADLVNLSYLPAATLFDHGPIQCCRPTRLLESWGRLGLNRCELFFPGLSPSLYLKEPGTSGRKPGTNLALWKTS